MNDMSIFCNHRYAQDIFKNIMENILWKLIINIDENVEIIVTECEYFGVLKVMKMIFAGKNIFFFLFFRLIRQLSIRLLYISIASSERYYFTSSIVIFDSPRVSL